MQGKITHVNYPEANKNANMRSNTRYEKKFFSCTCICFPHVWTRAEQTQHEKHRFLLYKKIVPNFKPFKEIVLFGKMWPERWAYVLWRKVHKNGFPPTQQTVKACIISSELCEQKLETWSLSATAIAYLTFLPFAWKCEHSLYLYARETHKRY